MTTKSTKDHLLDTGLAMLLEHGYSALGILRILEATGVPKGSFYHHFKSKEDFALQVIDRYMVEVHAGLEDCLVHSDQPPLDRVRTFFEGTREKYRGEGYLGCLLGGVGQELSGTSDVFRRKIDWCLAQIAGAVAKCLEEARARGDLPANADTQRMADLLIDCWEGAALRSRLRRTPAPLDAMLDFYFGAAGSTAATG